MRNLKIASKTGMLNIIDKIPWWGIFFMGLMWRLVVNVSIRSFFHVELFDITTEYNSTFWFIIRAVIIAPLIETFIYQYGVIEIFHAVIHTNKHANVAIAVLISAIIFGAAHFYSFEYMLIAFFMGVYLAFIYLHFKRLFESKKAGFWMTASFHALCNSISAIMLFL